MTWAELASEHFVARHAARDADDAVRVLEALEESRVRFQGRLPRLPGELSVVLHDSPAALDVAVPALAIVRRMAAPAARRYLAGWTTGTELHLLAPRLLAERASNVEGSLETLMLTPVALYARTAVAASNRSLPPPLGWRRMRTYKRWAWLAEGAAQHLAGQTPHLRAAVGRRLREGRPPSFPPALQDALLLGGTVLGLLAAEEGEDAVSRLILRLDPRGPEAALVEAFGGRALRHTEAAWRSALERA